MADLNNAVEGIECGDSRPHVNLRIFMLASEGLDQICPILLSALTPSSYAIQISVQFHRRPCCKPLPRCFIAYTATATETSTSKSIMTILSARVSFSFSSSRGAEAPKQSLWRVMAKDYRPR